MTRGQLIHSLCRFDDDDSQVVLRVNGVSYEIDNLVRIESVHSRPDTLFIIAQTGEPTDNYNRRILNRAILT
jgi:hypothetical protein